MLPRHSKVKMKLNYTPVRLQQELLSGGDSETVGYQTNQGKI